VSSIKINDFDDNNINNNNVDNEVPKSPVKKSKTCNEEMANRLNIGNALDRGPNHLGAVLETINEVSNSRVDSSELSDDSEEEQNNNDNNNKNINSINIKNIENNRKKETNSQTKKNDSDYNTATATKNTLHLV
jgi:hypothetical protein